MVWKRDEERTYSFLWFISAFLFAGVSAWAWFDNQVTRAPWSEDQQEFFALERTLSAKNLKAAERHFATASKTQADELEARIADLQKKQASSEYRHDQAELARLDEAYKDAESDKTFAKSDLDEVYYYRTVSEYDAELAATPALRGALQADIARFREREATHQHEMDDALARMTKLDTRRRELREKIAPVDGALEEANRQLTILRREVDDAQLRVDNANALSEQIDQVVFQWRYNKQGYLIEDVDRCVTCHKGTDSGQYTDPNEVRNPEFLTHPNRDFLLAAHPVQRFGCTSCHLGQGRATEAAFSHSRAAPVLLPGPEHGAVGEESHTPSGGVQHPSRVHVSWHMEGDHYWEEPMLKPGTLWRTPIGDDNDEFEVGLGSASAKVVKLEHRNYEVFDDLRQELQTKLNEAFPSAEGAAQEDTFVVHRVGNRVVLQTLRRMTDPEAEATPAPKFKVNWTEPALRRILGFSQDLKGANQYTADVSPEPSITNEGNLGTAGLQVPAAERERLILSAPFVESACLRCHTDSADFRPLLSVAEQVTASAQRQITAAHRTPEEQAAHASDPEPAAPPDPSTVPDLAPTLTEGRYLFRKLNCTGCHILDGFPGNRNAGPGLDNITAKVTPDFLYTWIRYPRMFRSGTRMPNFWPQPLDPETKSPVGRGTPQYHQWERQREEEVTAIAAYLISRSRGEVPTGYGDVEGANAQEGQEIFSTYGCQGCHVTADPASRPGVFGTRERDVAPNLSNIGHKTNADWLTWWIENPARYWTGTRMPNLRLTRREAASVAQYLMTLQAGQALTEAPAVLRQETLPPELVERGQKLIANYGCYGCHQINTFQDSPPIAPELNGHARKDVTTLDFGYAVPDHHQQTWETFVTWKLDAPRMYRRDRIELRMADFDLSAHEIRALMVFLKGTQEDRVAPQYNPQLSDRGRGILAGRQIIDDYNCRGCHIIEGHGADIRTYFPQTPDALALTPPVLRAEGFRVQPEWLYSFLRGPYKIRPWVKVRMPTFNFTNDQATAVARYFATLERQEFPFQRRPTPELEHDRWDTGNRLFSELKCQSCHILTDEVPAGRDPAQLAPNLQRAPERLRPDWIHRWLENPDRLSPNTRMPSFFSEPYSTAPSTYAAVAPGDAQENIELLVDFLTHLDRQPPVAPAAAPVAPAAAPAAPAPPAAPVP